jgi:sugar (pentulose or hexulose) kinase
MANPLRCVPRNAVITGWDFSTGAVKCLAFDLDGNTLAEVRLPTDLWSEGGVRELNLMQLEGQARDSTRAIAARLREKGRLADWHAGGISATHHTAGRIDADACQVRRAICWNDPSLAEYHAVGLERLGGQAVARQLTGGPWAIRYSLSHLVKDEACLAPEDWQRTTLILPHGSLAAGYLTGVFDTASLSSAASTGIMDLRTGQWCRDMLRALAKPEYRDLAARQLPRILDHNELIGPLNESLALEAKLPPGVRPLIFPTSDDQQAGLVGGGAVDAGQMAIVLGNSAVVNASSPDLLPESSQLDCMRLNWGPYLWMRCYNNGAQFLDQILGNAPGTRPEWDRLESEAAATPCRCEGLRVWPFDLAEPSLNVTRKMVRWTGGEPRPGTGRTFRAYLEALAYMIRRGVGEHEEAGRRKPERISVSGGIARSELMCKILASVLNRRIERLASFEGPALGAAVTALAALETTLRKQQGITEPFTVADAVAVLVKFRQPVEPVAEWQRAYDEGYADFLKGLADRGS